MRLASLKFVEFPGRDAEWVIDGLALSNINLLVGKNATGKSRVLNVIHFLSRLLTGEQQEIVSSGSLETVFQDGDNTWQYSLEFNEFVVTREDLLQNGENVLHRGDGGLGQILAVDIDGKSVRIRFSVPGPKIAVFAKRDDTQHPFLRPLHEWAASLRYFRFGGDMSPQNLAIKVKNFKGQVNERETGQLVPVFDKARKELGERYTNAVISDMSKLGYDIAEIDIRPPANLVTNVILPGDLVGVGVKEKKLNSFTDQPSISQGMFRSLSLVAQLNYYVLSNKVACILVDDVGEGLDFERSCQLIDLLQEKIKGASWQLIMATNDRFVMNNVPLEAWSVLVREGHTVHVKNYGNSKDLFDEFKFTGLSNFSFLEMDFANGPPTEEAVAHE